MRSLGKASLFSMLAVAAFAQGRGFGGHMPSPAPFRGFPNAHFGFSTSRRGFTGSVFTRPFFPGQRRFSQGFFFPWFDYGLGAYDYGYGYQPEPPVIVVEPPPQVPQVIVQAPPKPIRPEIKEYTPPAETGDSSPFSIALKDGSVRSAIAVWVAGDALHYIDPEGKAGQATLESVDRQATKKLNPGKNVQPWLP